MVKSDGTGEGGGPGTGREKWDEVEVSFLYVSRPWLAKRVI